MRTRDGEVRFELPVLESGGKTDGLRGYGKAEAVRQAGRVWVSWKWDGEVLGCGKQS
jgi:hypothetical protein